MLKPYPDNLDGLRSHALNVVRELNHELDHARARGLGAPLIASLERDLKTARQVFYMLGGIITDATGPA